MGAWGTGTFDNDTAGDWAYGLEKVDDLSLVTSTIDAVLAAGAEYLGSGQACEALAACEVVARLQGRWGESDAYTETVDEWVKAHPLSPSDELVDKACQAIARITTEPSELLELWDEGGRDDEWHSAIADLRQRVRPR